MRLLLRERIVPLAVLLGIGGVLPSGSCSPSATAWSCSTTAVHFAGVGVSALAAAAVSLALTIVGVRRNDGRVVLIGTGFTVMSALLAIHGLATPGGSSAERRARADRRGDAAGGRRGAGAVGRPAAAPAAQHAARCSHCRRSRSHRHRSRLRRAGLPKFVPTVPHPEHDAVGSALVVGARSSRCCSCARSRTIC
jgi:hypothetical protein